MHNNADKKTSKAAAWVKTDLSGYRVLLVDDNKKNREIEGEILKDAGVMVELAANGREAVRMVQESPEGYYHAILMDIQMPVMNGHEASLAIRAMDRQDAKKLPIIAVTASTMMRERQAMMKNGMNAYVAKPLDIDIFLEVLASCLRLAEGLA